jgi:hypothetical protein
MKLWQKLVLILFAAIPFIIYLFRPGSIGADSFWYINQACGISGHITNDILFDALNSIMPCNINLMKIFGGILFVGTVYLFAKMGELYDKEKGWWLGLMAASFTFFITEFFMYQNEPIAYFLFACSLYLVLLYDTTKKHRYLVPSLIIWLISGLFWKGVIYWGITLIIYAPITALIVIPVIIQYWDSFWWFLTPDPKVAFYMPFIGLIYLGVVIFFLFGLLKSSKKQALSWVFSIPMGIFAQRLYVLAVPTSLIVAFNGLKSLKMDPQTIESTLIVFTLFMSIFWGIHTYKEFPNQSDYELLQNLKLKTDTVQNSFGVGYYLINQGFNVSSYGWPHYPSDYNHIGYVVLENGIIDSNCPIDSNSDNLRVLKC